MERVGDREGEAAMELGERRDRRAEDVVIKISALKSHFLVGTVLWLGLSQQYIVKLESKSSVEAHIPATNNTKF